MTQQPRTPTPLSPDELVDYREHFIDGSGAYTDSAMVARLLATLDSQCADLLAQIEKAVDLDAIRQEVIEAADEAAAQYDEDGYPPEAIADAVYEILRVRLAAIRSAAPVEPTP